MGRKRGVVVEPLRYMGWVAREEPVVLLALPRRARLTERAVAVLAVSPRARLVGRVPADTFSLHISADANLFARVYGFRHLQRTVNNFGGVGHGGWLRR